MTKVYLDLISTASKAFEKVKIWSQADSKWAATVTIKTSEAATAVDFASTDERGRYGVYISYVYIMGR